MIKKFLTSGLIALCMIVMYASSLYASEGSVLLDGYSADEHALIADGQLYMAVRHVAEHIGWLVSWDYQASQVTLTDLWGERVVLTVGNEIKLIDYRNFATIEFLTDLFGLHVGMRDGVTIITTPAHNMLGLWWSDLGFVTVAFNIDGTASSHVLGENYIEFLWHTNEQFIYMQSEGFDNELYAFRTEGNRLTMILLSGNQFGRVDQFNRIAELDQALFGAWYSAEAGYMWFGIDGAIGIGETETGDFTWWIDAGLLHVQTYVAVPGAGLQVQIETLAYHFDNDVLVLQSEMFDFAARLYPAAGPPELDVLLYEGLIGSWVSTNGTQWRYVFTRQGTGVRGLPGFGSDFLQYFTWWTVDNEIMIDVIFASGMDTYFEDDREFFISEDGILSMRSSNALYQDMWVEFQQATFDAQDLVGTWSWDAGSAWKYIFNADGTGTRGPQDETAEHFTWTLHNDTLELAITTSENATQTESWTIHFAYYFITLLSNDTNELGWIYLRIQ